MATSPPASAAASPAPAAPASPSPSPGSGSGAAPSSAPRSEADFLAGAPAAVDSLFERVDDGSEAGESEDSGERAPASPDAIFDEIEQVLPDDVREQFKQRLGALKTEAGRVKALAEERRALATTSKHNGEAGQAWMQLFGLALQQMRAANIDTSQLEQYAGGQGAAGGGEGAGFDPGAGQDLPAGDFDYVASAREAISEGLGDTYWGQYNAARDEAESQLQVAQDLVEAQHPSGEAALKAARERLRQIEQIHSRKVAAVAAHPSRAAFDHLQRRLAALEARGGDQEQGQQFVSVVTAGLREQSHAVDDLGKPLWREGGKFPFFRADGKALAELGQRMIQPMAEFWEKRGLDPSDPDDFADAFHAVAGRMGISTQPSQAGPQEAVVGRRGGGDPTLPGGASIPVAAVGRSPVQSPESRRLAILEKNRRGMREAG